MLLIMVSLIGLMIGVTAALLFAHWSDSRLKRRSLSMSLETVRGSGGIITVAPLDPRRNSLIALQEEPGSERSESVEPEDL
jgi:hypothetical protein